MKKKKYTTIYVWVGYVTCVLYINNPIQKYPHVAGVCLTYTNNKKNVINVYRK